MVNIDDARRHLRIDGTQDDEEINQKLIMARALISRYVGPVFTGSKYYKDFMYTQPAEVGPDDSCPAPEYMLVSALDAACLLALGDIWLNRESSTANPLSPAVRNLLDLYREPICA